MLINIMYIEYICMQLCMHLWPIVENLYAVLVIKIHIAFSLPEKASHKIRAPCKQFAHL